MTDIKKINQSYELARDKFLEFGVDTDAVLKEFYTRKISLHCWQGDDVAGFEPTTAKSQNVITGNYPGRARNGSELRADIEKVFSFSPAGHKVNLHSIYAEPASPVSREKLTVLHFDKWISWAKQNKLGLDYNSSFFAHDMMDGCLSLSSPNKKNRRFWIEHAVTSREIAYKLAQATGEKCIHNIWVPDGLKDNPADRAYFRGLLKDSLDEIFEKKYDKSVMADALEGKLFGIGAECFTVGSYDFYLAYAAQNKIGICLDSGHFHPTEQVADKLSALKFFFDDILLHVSRGVRWDSDHVVIYNDELTGIMHEAKRADMLDTLNIGLDYFDASINRVFAWTVGLRAAGRALLDAMLEPVALLKKAETTGKYSERLALSEEFKALPSAAVWDYACIQKGVPVGKDWIDAAAKYEADVTSKR